MAQALSSPKLPVEVQADLDNGFFITDPDTGYQRAFRHGDALAWTFKTGYEGYFTYIEDFEIHLGTCQADVVFVDLTDDEIEAAARTYYGSIDNLIEVCGGDECEMAFLICEAHYEMHHEKS